jgi:dTDP-4-amino-4,6-dideoxygalactose transaminase
MNWKVPLFEPDFGPAELEAVQAPVREGWLTTGPYTEKLEAALCGLTGSAHAVAVSNCTAALHLGLLACGIGPGDEVLCPTLTFVATANAIRYVGATPVFCESVGPDNLNLDPEDVRAKLTSRSRAVMVVHYAGYPADMPRLSALARERGLVVIEDCAHALVSSLHGRACGTWGRVGCFSFFSNKNATCGEGGAITTQDPALADRLRRMRSHGMTSMTLDRHKGRAYSYDVVDLGYNFRLDEVRSSLMLAQLGRLGGFLEARRRHVELYARLLGGTEVTLPDFGWDRLSRPGDSVGPHILPVLLPPSVDRLQVMAALRARGVQSSIHYPPVHQFSSFRDTARPPRLPRTEGLASRQLTLPLYPSMTEEQVRWVCGSLKDALASCRAGESVAAAGAPNGGGTEGSAPGEELRHAAF